MKEKKDKEKKNAALALFKAILEQRKTDPQQLYKHFTELILCHWYGRYKAYGNIYQNENFYFAARNAVFQYHALLYILKQLNLLKGMENFISQSNAEEIKKGFPNSAMVIIEGAAHGDRLFVGSPQIRKVMLEFMKGNFSLVPLIVLPPIDLEMPTMAIIATRTKKMNQTGL